MSHPITLHTQVGAIFIRLPGSKEQHADVDYNRRQPGAVRILRIVDYDFELDEKMVHHMALRAARNKSKTSKLGPVRVRATRTVDRVVPPDTESAVLP